MGPSETLAHVRAAELSGIVPLGRVCENSRALIQKYLDIGVAGIVVPHVESEAEAVRAVVATRMGRGGTRSVCPIVHASAYSADNWASFAAGSARDLLVIPIIESVVGVENVEEILAVDGIDFAFFGPGDYAVDAGVGLADPALAAAWEKVVVAARKQGKRVITTTITPGMRAEQVGGLVHNMDMVLIESLLRQDLMRTRAGLRVPAEA
jgi:2-keto-3-deoxy-L-rhamnonate aldolase RhmA